MSQVEVTRQELERRTIRRSDFVSCNQAFIDCRTPGSDRKENYSMIGPGVTQSPNQVVNLREAHGYNIGAAAMPHGIVNNLHLHFTGSMRHQTLVELAERRGVHLPQALAEDWPPTMFVPPKGPVQRISGALVPASRRIV